MSIVAYCHLNTSCIVGLFYMNLFKIANMSNQNKTEGLSKENEVQLCDICGQVKEIIQAEGENPNKAIRHFSCTSCTDKPEAQMNGLSAAAAQTSKTVPSDDKRLTPMLQEVKEQDLSQKENKFKSAYEEWKAEVRVVRAQLKTQCNERTLIEMMDAVEKQEVELRKLYDGIRSHVVPSQEIKRKIDACTAVTTDLMKIMGIRLTEDDIDFDAEAENARLHLVLDNEYARSIYGSIVSKAIAHSHHSEHSIGAAGISGKRAETAVELAAKKAELEL